MVNGATTVLCLSMFVLNRRSAETSGLIELGFGTDASFDLFYTVL